MSAPRHPTGATRERREARFSANPSARSDQRTWTLVAEARLPLAATHNANASVPRTAQKPGRSRQGLRPRYRRVRYRLRLPSGPRLLILHLPLLAGTRSSAPASMFGRVCRRGRRQSLLCAEGRWLGTSGWSAFLSLGQLWSRGGVAANARIQLSGGEIPFEWCASRAGARWSWPLFGSSSQASGEGARASLSGVRTVRRIGRGSMRSLGPWSWRLRALRQESSPRAWCKRLTPSSSVLLLVS
jgi:hypothetical protein